MRNLLELTLTLASAIVLTACATKGNDAMSDSFGGHSRRNSIYYWKTVFDIDSTSMSFIKKHEIDRIYLRMFDVVTEKDYLSGNLELVPNATTKFVSSVPDNIEIVPVTYITTDALRAMTDKEHELASLIVDRLLAMSSYNECGKINEIQLDCDWTSTTRSTYSRLCRSVKNILYPKGIKLSITIRLHQLQETPPPADKGVLMLYNTGALKSPATNNSILDFNDVKPYMKQMEPEIPLDYAYPVFGWGVKFRDNRFLTIVPYGFDDVSDNEYVRNERPSTPVILKVKDLVERNIGKPAYGNILYHLDNTQLENYNDNEITQIFNY